MSSVLYNAAALSALQSLNQTQQSLNTVQNQVSTGLAVATAADNSSYWSVAAQLNQDNGVVTAANTALTEGQSMLSTANSAIKFGHHDAEFDGDRANGSAELPMPTSPPSTPRSPRSARSSPTPSATPRSTASTS